MSGIRLELRCVAARHCILAVISTDRQGRLVADVTMRDAVAAVEHVEWTTRRYAVPISEDYLLLSCRHEQGIALSATTVRAYLADTPRGVRFVA